MKAKQVSQVTIPFISGDGIGPEIMEAAQNVLDHAVQTAFCGSKELNWLEVQAGKSAFDATGKWLPVETLAALKKHRVSFKGPLTTPVGGGIRSLNVYLRQELDLYVCLRQARWFEGLPSPHRNPQGIDITIFRENTEDIYIGIEYQAGTSEQRRWLESFRQSQPADYAKLPYPEECGIGIKPVSKPGSQRLVKAALQWALDNHKRRLTLAHKGNIMKFTEGAFRTWGYELAESEFKEKIFTRPQFQVIGTSRGQGAADAAKQKALSGGKLWVDDVIADVVFEQLITTPQQFDVIATTNLNGDFISDAAAALVGGIGISPGANINYETGTAVFEANHGSAEELAGKGIANPGSLILSGEMMLRFLGWHEAADLVRRGIAEAIRARQVTFDLARQIEGAQALGTKEFAQAVINYI
ncbi:MAG: NADP-dependent isocitrate dehydrogenase [Anaerolineaceae bacterium]|nr:NADP-dependent isocitrate dehydrogenase [Anaerolineaceae bacterium]